MAIVNTHYGFCAKGGAVPKFTYTGEYNVRDDGVVELLTSGTLVFLNPAVIDIFCVGGGGSGGNVSTTDYTAQIAAGGGGAGYCKTAKKISVSGSYAITVGAGGLNTQNSVYQGEKQYGGSSSFGSLVSAGGGMSAYYGFVGGQLGYSRGAGGDGGSGGGSPSTSSSTLGPGGYDGADGGKGTKNVPGSGAGTTTREFGESNGKLYAGGGGGGLCAPSDTTVYSKGGQGGGGHGGWVGKNESLSIAPENGKANTGGGGGGMAAYKVSPQAIYYSGGQSRGGNGGSGIVCFRKARTLAGE